jgi:hypothetical protein
MHTITIPDSFTRPRFSFGDKVTIDEDGDIYTVTGMRFQHLKKPDRAIWSYTVEDWRGAQVFDEDELELAPVEAANC